MILSDREIRAAIARGAVQITPVPHPECWSSTAVDLTLDKQLARWDVPGGGGIHTHFSPHDPDYDYAALAAKFAKPEPIPPNGYLLKPSAFVLGWTKERIRLPHPSRIAARVEGKSSLARLGVGVHVTAPTIHAGFGYTTKNGGYAGSPLQLEIWNVGPLEIMLKDGMRICQLIFEIVDGTPDKGYEGQFTIQGPGNP
jgi:dCTP deaminase